MADGRAQGHRVGAGQAKAAPVALRGEAALAAVAGSEGEALEVREVV